jgi:hypothetical protein
MCSGREWEGSWRRCEEEKGGKKRMRKWRRIRWQLFLYVPNQ